MTPEGFIAGRIRFKGRMAIVAIAISFFVIIVAVSISDGFRREIRRGVSSMTGDVLLTNAWFNYSGDSRPVDVSPSYLPEIEKIEGIENVSPAVYRAGIFKKGEQIHGLLFKGTTVDTVSLGVRIPSRLAAQTGLTIGDNMLVYFVSDKVKARKFKVVGTYDSIVDIEGGQIAYVPIGDLRRLNGWSEDEASVLEVTLSDNYRGRKELKRKSEEIGATAYLSPDSDEETLIATSSVDRYSQLFDWLDLIDFNVWAILILMAVVAGFNMISGLLILLLRNTSTIGTLKTLGMKDRAIGKVFLRVAARLAATGMLAGNAAALLFCLIQGSTHLIKLNPENYFVTFVPVSINLPWILLADVAAFAVIALLMLLPSLFISRIDPASTVKSE